MRDRRTADRGGNPTKRPLRFDIMLLAVVASLAIGVAVGAVYGSMAAGISGAGVFDKEAAISGSGAFLEAFVKYGKITLIIWFMAFVPLGTPLVLVVTAYKGASLGFASALAIRNYGAAAIKYITVLLLPQNFIAVASYIILSAAALRFAMGLAGVGAARGAVSRPRFLTFRMIPPGVFKGMPPGVPEYAAKLVFSLVCAVAAAAVETYISPVLAGLIL